MSAQGATDAGGNGAVSAGGTPTSAGSTSAGGSIAIAGTSSGAGAGTSAGAGAGAHPIGDAGAAGIGGGSDNGGASGSVGVGGGASGGHAGTAGTSAGGTGGTGTAGTGATGAGGGGSGATGGTSGGPAIELIDDFEDLDLLILPVHRRNGPWYAFHDATAAGVQTFANSLLTGTNVRAGSTAALHMTATGFTDYGAGFGADFVNTAGKKVPYDVSAYKGIRFYAKVASGSQTSMKVLIPTTYSDPMGGKCSDTVDLMHCNDHLYYPLSSIKTTWDVYECDFSDLVQQGFGLPQASLDPTSVYSVQFTFVTKSLPADVWVDDVAFVLQ